MSLEAQLFDTFETIWNRNTTGTEEWSYSHKKLDLGTLDDRVPVIVGQIDPQDVALQDASALPDYVDVPADVFVSSDGTAETFVTNSDRIDQFIDLRPPQLHGIECASVIYSATKVMFKMGRYTIRQRLYAWDSTNGVGRHAAAGYLIHSVGIKPRRAVLYPVVLPRHADMLRQFTEPK